MGQALEPQQQIGHYRVTAPLGLHASSASVSTFLSATTRIRSSSA